MSEKMTETPEHSVERKLWFEGPNYTADAVIIDEEAAKILLIQRGDTGEWALPGGFVDASDDSAYNAAIREAQEEAGIHINGYSPLIFRGIVDDPRNSLAAWIETSAYLFAASSATEITSGDDAQDAQWHDTAHLPELYASHQTIVERALDHLAGKQLIDTFTSPETITAIDAGHMEYNKFIFQKDGTAVFAKQHDIQNFTDIDRAQHSYEYLEKEALTMAHLRRHGFSAIPERSVLYVDTLSMDALQEEAGWKWRAEPDSIDAYITDSLAIFRALEATPVPADSFSIEPSYESMRTEGWWTFTDETVAQLEQRLRQFAPRLTEASRATAQQLLDEINDLHQSATAPRTTSHFVFCHHDVRQSNLAWHPEHGSKLVDWSWAGLGEPNSDSTSFLIDLAKSGHDISAYHEHINPHHCLTLIGFWLAHSTWPAHKDDTVRFQQFVSALSGYEVLKALEGSPTRPA